MSYLSEYQSLRSKQTGRWSDGVDMLLAAWLFECVVADSAMRTGDDDAHFIAYQDNSLRLMAEAVFCDGYRANCPPPDVNPSASVVTTPAVGGQGVGTRFRFDPDLCAYVRAVDSRVRLVVTESLSRRAYLHVHTLGSWNYRPISSFSSVAAAMRAGSRLIRSGRALGLAEVESSAMRSPEGISLGFSSFNA